MNRKNFMDNFLKTLTVLSFSLSVASFTNFETQTQKRNIELLEKTKVLQAKINSKDERIAELLEANKDCAVSFMDRILRVLDKKNDVESIPKEDILKILEDDQLINDVENIRKSLDDNLQFIGSSLFDKIKDIINSDIIGQYQQFLDTLSYHQLLAIINISAFMFIFLNIISLFGVYFSESLIQYFNLEEKYPRIGRFIKIRRTYYKYYYIINAIIIFVMTVISIYCNLTVLLSS